MSEHEMRDHNGASLIVEVEVVCGEPCASCRYLLRHIPQVPGGIQPQKSVWHCNFVERSPFLIPKKRIRDPYLFPAPFS